MWQLLVLRTYKTEDNKRKKNCQNPFPAVKRPFKRLNCHLKKRSNFFGFPWGLIQLSFGEPPSSRVGRGVLNALTTKKLLIEELSRHRVL